MAHLGRKRRFALPWCKQSRMPLRSSRVQQDGGSPVLMRQPQEMILNPTSVKMSGSPKLPRRQ